MVVESERARRRQRERGGAIVVVVRRVIVERRWRAGPVFWTCKEYTVTREHEDRRGGGGASRTNVSVQRLCVLRTSREFLNGAALFIWTTHRITITRVRELHLMVMGTGILGFRAVFFALSFVTNLDFAFERKVKRTRN